MLAHHRQREGFFGLFIAQIDAPDPLGIGLWAAIILPAIFFLTGLDAIIDICVSEFGSINQHSPARLIG